LGFFFLEWY